MLIKYYDKQIYDYNYNTDYKITANNNNHHKNDFVEWNKKWYWL